MTALATEVYRGDPERFADGKALASYVGMIPREYSSGERLRLGGLTKQGSPLLRFLWGEAGAHAARRDPELQRVRHQQPCSGTMASLLCDPVVELLDLRFDLHVHRLQCTSAIGGMGREWRGRDRVLSVTAPQRGATS